MPDGGRRCRGRRALGRPVRRRPVGRAGRRCAARPTSTGGWRRTTSPASRAHARVLHRAGLLDDDELDGLLAGLDALDADVESRRRSARRRTTRTCTPRSSAAWSSGSAPSSAAGCGPAGRATTRSPPWCGCTCATTPASIAGAGARPRRRAGRPGRGAPGAPSCPGAPTCSTRSRCCSRTTCWRTPGRCCATSSGCATGTARGAAVAVRLRRARRLVARARPEAGRRRARLRGPVENSIDGTAARDVVAEFAFVARDDRGRPLAAGRGGRSSGRPRSSAFVTLDDAYSTGSSIMPQKKNPDVAELARGKAGRLIGDLDRAARDAEGAAARVQPRPAGGQGAGLRRRRHPRGPAAGRSPAWSRTLRFDTDRLADAGAAGLRARDRRRRVAGAARACRSATRTRSPAPACAAARSAASGDVELADLTDDDLAAISPRLTPDVRDGARRRRVGRLARRSRRHGAAPGRRAARRADDGPGGAPDLGVHRTPLTAAAVTAGRRRPAVHAGLAVRGQDPGVDAGVHAVPVTGRRGARPRRWRFEGQRPDAGGVSARVAPVLPPDAGTVTRRPAVVPAPTPSSAPRPSHHRARPHRPAARPGASRRPARPRGAAHVIAPVWHARYAPNQPFQAPSHHAPVTPGSRPDVASPGSAPERRSVVV